MYREEKKRSLRKQFLSAVGAQGFSQVVTVLWQVLAVPILLSIWGAERYGAWVIISTIPTYLTMMDLGFAQICANDMTMRMARGDRAGAEAVNQAAWIMNIGASCAAVLIMIAVVTVVPLGRLFNISENDGLLLSTFLLSLISVNAIIFGVVGAAMRSVGLFPMLVITNAFTRIVSVVLLAVGAYCGFGFVGCSLLMYIGSTINVFVFSWSFYRRHPEFLPKLKMVKLSFIYSYIPPSVSYMNYTLANAIMVQGSNLLVGAMLGPSSVVVVSTIRTLTRLGRTGASILNFAMEPIIAQLYGREDVKSNKKATVLLNTMVAVGTFVFTAGMWFGGEQFLALWTHGIVINQTELFRLLLLSVVLEICWSTLQTPYVSTNRHRLFSRHNLILTIVFFGGMALFVDSGGVSVVGWASLLLQVAITIMTAYVIRYGKY